MKKAKIEFNGLRHEFELNAARNSKIEENEELDVKKPKLTLNFKNINSILEMSTYDIVGTYVCP